VKSAESLRPIAEQYAKELKEAAEKDDVGAYQDAFLDTAAFVTIVIEAGKTNRDANKIKEAVATLEKLLARQEQKLASQTVRSKADYSTLKETRAHLTSARGLLD
jgi:hypothetical protein